MPLQIYHRIQFQKWQFLYFLSLSFLQTPTHVLIGNAKKEIVCKFVYKKKENENERNNICNYLTAGGGGPELFEHPARSDCFWPAHMMVEVFRRKSFRSAFDDDHRNFGCVRTVQFGVNGRLSKKKMFSSKKRLSAFLSFWSLRFAAQKWLFISLRSAIKVQILRLFFWRVGKK